MLHLEEISIIQDKQSCRALYLISVCHQEVTFDVMGGCFLPSMPDLEAISIIQSKAGLLPRYHTTNVNDIQPRLELTSTICAGRDTEYRSQAWPQHTFPDFSWPHRDCITDMNHIRPHVGLPSTIKPGNDHSWDFGGNFNGPVETYPRPSCNVQCSAVERWGYNFDVPYSLPEGAKHGFRRRMVEVQKRTFGENLYLKHENHMNFSSFKRRRVQPGVLQL
ncbi:hypothetical protein SLE2022_399740 [Rubroshorea leprosula]